MVMMMAEVLVLDVPCAEKETMLYTIPLSRNGSNVNAPAELFSSGISRQVKDLLFLTSVV